ncbi:MAG TPA: choice-of-anchor B family protein, partial [Phycisphaerae bacterium]
FDVLNLASPMLVNTFTSGATSIDHNLYTLGNLIFESNYRSGLRVFDASNPVGPVQIAWFDTYPEDDYANFNGLWSNYPYLPSGTILGGDIEKGLFVWRLGDPLLVFSYPNGLPNHLNPSGQTIQVQITPQGGSALQPGTAKLHYNAGSGFIESDLVPAGGDAFQALIPALPCGASVAFYFTAQSVSGETVKDPPTAPFGTYSATVRVAQPVLWQDDMETDIGWTVGWPGDNATTGIWERVDPVGTAAQPEDDHTPGAGTMCWVTGQGVPGGGVGDNDVDGGQTTLVTPTLNLLGISNPIISYWRWYSNNTGSNPGADVFVVDITSDAGASWVNVETVGPGGGETTGGWFLHSFHVSDFVTPTAQVRLRFVASDLGGGSVVEAAVDDFRVSVLTCIPGDLDGDGHINLADFAGFAECMAGPNAAPSPTQPPTPGECLDVFDSDADVDVDLFDLSELLSNYSG